jgi:hypothetical protein
MGQTGGWHDGQRRAMHCNSRDSLTQGYIHKGDSMIDFNNSSFVKMSKVNPDKLMKDIVKV